MTDYDTTEKVVRTDEGFRVSVKSKRGTGTRDQDEVSMEYRTETQPTPDEIENMNKWVTKLMDERRAHKPDEETDDDESG